MRVSYDNRYLYVSLWGGGKVQQYDIADPRHPTLLSEVAIPQPNMMKLSADNRRLYVTNSLLSSLDGSVQFGAWLINVGPDGMTIDERFNPDFRASPRGRPAHTTCCCAERAQDGRWPMACLIVEQSVRSV